jgi:hypothetical protein
MKRFLIATTAVALPLAAASMAFGQGSTTPTTATPNQNRVVNVQAGATKRVNLSKVSAGTGYAWKWITKPKASVAKGLAVKTSKAVRPGGPTWAFTRVLGLAEDTTTSGQLGLFGPGQTSPTRTITLKITVTGDGR